MYIICVLCVLICLHLSGALQFRTTSTSLYRKTVSNRIPKYTVLSARVARDEKETEQTAEVGGGLKEPEDGMMSIPYGGLAGKSC